MPAYKVLKKQTATVIWRSANGDRFKDNFGLNGNRIFIPGDILPEEFIEVVSPREIKRRLKYGLIEEIKPKEDIKTKEA